MTKGCIWLLLRFCAFAIPAYLLTVFGVATIWDLLGRHDRDGGAMGLAFIIGPAVAAIAGIAGSAWLGSSSRRKANNNGEGGS